MWTRKTVGATVAFWTLAIAAGLLGFAGTAIGQQSRMETFKLDEPIIEEVPFCSKREAAEHVALTTSKRGPDAGSNLFKMYFTVGICGRVLGAITYREQLGAYGQMNVYRATMETVTLFIVTTWKHESL